VRDIVCNVLRFLHQDIWTRLTAVAKQESARCHAAIAFFGTGVARMLPLSKGSVLVVDMSDTVLRAGLTNPSELLKLIRRGVAVYNYPTLHCKVAVFRLRAFLGS
jgi:hypothetical protein